MAVFRPFRAFRPAIKNQSLIPALPYDVMSSDEAREKVKDNPLSFLHIDKAEIDLPKGTDPYSAQVYEKARENLLALEKNGDLIQDDSPCLYIYREVMNGRSQTGIVGCASIDDYINNVIKKHEHTLAKKEQDRINHVNICNANTGPIFLTYRKRDDIEQIVSLWIKEHSPVYDFDFEGVRQTVWVIDNVAVSNRLQTLFSKVESLYIADGHHRCASAVKDYNRVVSDLNGYSFDEFLSAVSKNFDIKELEERRHPEEKHTFCMYYDKKWYLLTAKKNSFDSLDPVARLDVSILQNNLLAPILNIIDPKNDDRIDFIGGIRGLDELERRANADMKIAFAMYPTTVDDLMSIADAGKIMPPKSTWFEPKLLSGIFIHHLS